MLIFIVFFRYSLGDARRPLHETAVLVEDVVHTQLINLVRANNMGKKRCYMLNLSTGMNLVLYFAMTVLIILVLVNGIPYMEWIYILKFML